MATVTVPVDEIQKQIDTMLTQGALIHFIKNSDFLTTAASPEDVLHALVEQIDAQNTEVFTWLDKLNGGLFSQ
jgi:hypothetical protein